ncbi:hypothetical protein TVAG_181520 [Trichomonas vaginalis G3]|uniref:Uncharacterized protein n=1 Tax=Trichomonas vaginalis (strain ATCC PRA-98 / G3) TaxID=412133 RepID=A2G212_TRIV3|nr:hypothetical protein TVAGG3_0570430 [Trichomonas vaginalis G3]EAX88804.1 hypothetical protein TVAG_181520 [Trichomonas vaginalis G3]KAI5521865.1 hypothetical protein TVAGG3_0570430 [Trichomonas vaginalis G3]|eukprot:XP_001301734.1 hypothetical protein [Trichomonas vaginalis G3]
MNDKEEILFSASATRRAKPWEVYLEEINQLIPQKKAKTGEESKKPEKQIYFYDDVVIAIREIKPLKLLVTIPANSLAKVEPTISAVLDQLEKIVKFCCDGEFSQETITERDHYIRLRMLCQKEFTTNGFMRFIPESEFNEVVAF